MTTNLRVGRSNRSGRANRFRSSLIKLAGRAQPEPRHPCILPNQTSSRFPCRSLPRPPRASDQLRLAGLRDRRGAPAREHPGRPLLPPSGQLGLDPGGCDAFVIVAMAAVPALLSGSGDPRAAFTSGVQVETVRIVYVTGGVLAAAAGFAFTIALGSGDPLAANAYTLIGIAGAVLGGVSLSGGRGGCSGPRRAAQFFSSCRTCSVSPTSPVSTLRSPTA